MKKKSLYITILTLVLVICLTSCSKEAKFYEYTGPMPFENSMGVEFGMTVEEVESIVGALEEDNTTDQDYYVIKSGSPEEGGFYSEKYRFDDNGKLDLKDVSIFFICEEPDENKVFDVDTACAEYEKVMPRIYEHMKNELGLPVDIPESGTYFHSYKDETESMGFSYFDSYYDGTTDLRTKYGHRIYAEIFLAIYAN